MGNQSSKTNLAQHTFQDTTFISSHYADCLTDDLIYCLAGYAEDPDKLVSLYQEDMENDILLNQVMNLELIALELNEIALNLKASFEFDEKEKISHNSGYGFGFK